MRALLAFSISALVFLDTHSILVFGVRSRGSLLNSKDSPLPPDVPGEGALVLQPIQTQACGGSGGSDSKSTQGSVSDSMLQADIAGERGTLEYQADTRRRNEFVCTAACAAREPQLEKSLAPWADWSENSTSVEMVEMFLGFCRAERTCKDPFVIVTLWKGDVHARACGGQGPKSEKADGLGGLTDPSLYLIGPEDLSLIVLLSLGVQKLSTLPENPIVFGMYLSDYSCLLDRHLIGPGLPMFSYIARDTSWLIPFPSSFTLMATREVEMLEKKRLAHRKSERRSLLQDAADDAQLMASSLTPWAKRKSKAFWIGAVTGPWEFSLDADLMALPRLNLLRKTKEFPEQLHTEWTNLATYGITWVNDSTHIAGAFAKQPHSMKDVVGVEPSKRRPASEWSDYKYYLNIDGVVMGGRLNRLMAQGGVVLQQQSGYQEYYNALLQPYVNFVPISYDLSDLVPTIKWLQKNDAKAEEIAKNARNLAATRLRFEDQLCYIWRAFEGLGAKTSRKASDSRLMEDKLKDNSFVKISLQDDMRSTLETFWGQKLEKVTLGPGRTMSSDGIDFLQWTWDRMSGLNKRAHGS